MRRSSHLVFVNARVTCEITRYEIIFRISDRCDYDARIDRAAQLFKIGLELADGRFRFEFDQEFSGAVLAAVEEDGLRLDLQGFSNGSRQFGLIRRQSGEIHFDSVAIARGDQSPAQRMKSSFFILRKPACFPQRMRASERRMAAERNFDGRSKPSQIEASVLP